MKVHLTDELYTRFRDLLESRAGLSYPEQRRDDLAHGLNQVLVTSGQPDLTALYADALADGPSWEAMLAHLTVGETRFFRNEPQFTALRQHIIPELLVRRASVRALRLWSAGCATGEEPYSLAMLLTDLLPDMGQWAISMLATDLNPHFLARARAALYGAWSFRETPDALRNRFFRPEEGRWRLLPEIQRMVNFARLNLVEDAYPSITNGTCALDMIICRNVTIYFSAETTRQVVGRFYASLAPGGWLVVGHSEPQANLYYQFETHNFPNTILYRKPLDAPLFAYDAQSGTFSAGSTPILQSPAVARAPSGSAPRPGRPTPAALAARQPPNQTRTLSQSAPLPTSTGGPGPTGQANPASRHDLRTSNDLWSLIQQKLAQGEKVSAEVLLHELLQRQPGHIGALVAVGRLCADRADWDDARRFCEAALTHHPLSTEASYLMGQVHEHEGHLDEALSAYRRTVYIDRTFAPGLLGMANIWRQMGRPAEARRSYRNLVRQLAELAPTAPVPGVEGATAGELLALANQQLATLP